MDSAPSWFYYLLPIDAPTALLYFRFAGAQWREIRTAETT